MFLNQGTSIAAINSNDSSHLTDRRVYIQDNIGYIHEDACSANVWSLDDDNPITSSSTTAVMSSGIAACTGTGLNEVSYFRAPY
jgi:Fungal fucose-specific lectin